MKNTKDRFLYLDLIKTVAILFVCLYHFWWGRNIEYTYEMERITFLRRSLANIFSCGVPLFLMANGALLLNKPFHAERHYKRLASLFLQFLIWRALTVLCIGFSRGIDFGALTGQQIVNHFLLAIPMEGIDEAHLWFIPMLCCIYLLFPFYRKVFEDEATDRNSRISLVVFLVLMYGLNILLTDFTYIRHCLPFTQNILTFQLSTFQPFSSHIGTMSVYFLLGGFLHKYLSKVSRVPILLPVCAIVLGLAMLAGEWYTLSVYHVTTYDMVFGGYSTTGTLLCTLGIFALAEKMDACISRCPMIIPVLHGIGRNTIYVYYSHWIIGCTVLPHITHRSGSLFNLAKACFFIVTGSLLGEGINRVTKFLKPRSANSSPIDPPKRI